MITPLSINDYPLLAPLQSYQECWWANPNTQTASIGLQAVKLSEQDIMDAEARLNRFAPLFMRLFPETIATEGIIESPIIPAPSLQQKLQERYVQDYPGQLLLKLDSELPISGSIKARGGIYEVLVHAENLAIKNSLLKLNDNYATLASPACKAFFQQYTIAVGSTGNLGLSIGIMSAKLGFNVQVHMSADARQWKKNLLRQYGVNVIEHNADYSVAVKAGRETATDNPFIYFIDDENSTNLFLGYAVAAYRLKEQLKQLNITVNAQHPLFVYLPCGVGGGPGGVTFGLKTVFGDHVHCIFAEPTHSPSMLLGLYTSLHDKISVQDIGIDNKTVADGLACGRPSGFVGAALQHVINGLYTVDDYHMLELVTLCYQTEQRFVEPSSATSLVGFQHILKDQAYLDRYQLDAKKLANATHIAWMTGGSMVPQEEREKYLLTELR